MAKLIEIDEFFKKYEDSDSTCITRCESCKHHIEVCGEFGYHATCSKFNTFIPNELRYLEIDRLDNCKYEVTDWFKTDHIQYAVRDREYENITSQVYFVAPQSLIPRKFDNVSTQNPDYSTLAQSQSLSGTDCISKCSACEHFRFFARTGVAKCSKFPWNINLDVFLGAIDCKEFVLWSYLKKQGYIVADAIIETRKKVLKHYKDFRGTVFKCPRDLFFDEEFREKRLSCKAR